MLIGQVYNLNLKPISLSPDTPMKTWDEYFQPSEFSTFNHRGVQINKRIIK